MFDAAALTAQINQILGDQLTALRARHGWSLAHASDYTGLSEGTIAGFEAGTDSPTIEQCAALCAAYGVAVEDLLSGLMEAVTEARSRTAGGEFETGFRCGNAVGGDPKPVNGL